MNSFAVIFELGMKGQTQQALFVHAVIVGDLVIISKNGVGFFDLRSLGITKIVPFVRRQRRGWIRRLHESRPRVDQTAAWGMQHLPPRQRFLIDSFGHRRISSHSAATEAKPSSSESQAARQRLHFQHKTGARGLGLFFGKRHLRLGRQPQCASDPRV